MPPVGVEHVRAGGRVFVPTGAATARVSSIPSTATAAIGASGIASTDRVNAWCAVGQDTPAARGRRHTHLLVGDPR
jgi:hypothetical protein